MVDSDLILPVLDGLDEMDAPDAEPVLASAALDRLNEPPWRNRSVVVACRSRVYTAVRDLRGDAGLQFATTVTLQPFSAADIYIYLEQYRDELGIAEAAWAPVTDQLEQAGNGVLATALRTPWILSLAATALYRGGRQTAVELSACSDGAQIRQILFASLIPAAVESAPRTGGTRTYTEENVQRWLTTLARHLPQRRTQHSGGAQMALDQIWHLAGPRRCRVLHVVLGGFMFAAGFTLAPLLLGATVGEALRVGLVAGIVAMLRFGLAAGPDVGKLRAKRRRRIVWRGRAVTRRFAWRVPGRTRWRRGLKRGLMVGLLLGIPIGVFVSTSLVTTEVSSRDYVIVLIFALPVLGFALVSGLVSGLGTTQGVGKVVK
ncbi:MAG TPA: hypothetical protein VN255_04350 [Mycobacterium sp.]|nr:hypothetical protein [Mycobacterium sp.]